MQATESATTEIDCPYCDRGQIDCPYCDRGQIAEIVWTPMSGGSAGRRNGLTTACPLCRGTSRCTRTVYQDADLILHKVLKNKGDIP